ncbi:RidA family protein [Blastococcus sp. CT_GayMR20]|nr:RidA family protein [Blastococcus sp. CT_GayMR20]
MGNVVQYRNPDSVPEPLGMYSHVSIHAGIVHVAGQVGIDSTGQIPSTFDAQFAQAMRNVADVLDSVGCDLGDILATTTYLVDRGDIAEFYAARAKLYPEIFPRDDFPPNTLLVVNGLVREELRVEIQLTAAHAAS